VDKDALMRYFSLPLCPQAFVPEVEQVMQAALKVVYKAKVGEHEGDSECCFFVFLEELPDLRTCVAGHKLEGLG